MQFVLYSEKTVAQCLTSINARMHVKGTTSRPGLDGWVEKSGAFAVGVTTPVIGKFTRRTFLKAKVERQNGMTIIRGSVPEGVTKQGMVVIFVALAVVAAVIMGSGSVLLGLVLIPVGAYFVILLRGDFHNSEYLLDEVRKTLKAKPTPIKKSTTSDTKTARPTVARPTSTRPGSAAPKKATTSTPVQPPQRPPGDYN